MTGTAGPPTVLGEALALVAARGLGGTYVFHLADGARTVGTEELFTRALARAGQLLDRGVTVGDRVGVLGPNHPVWLEWAWGTWVTGATLVPLPAPIRVLNRTTFAEQTAAFVRAFGCKVVAAHPRYLPGVPEGVGVDWTHDDPSVALTSLPDGPRPEDIATIMCTSGSTAFPKGVSHSYAKAFPNPGKAFFDGGATSGVRIISWQPLFHATGLATQMQPVLAGADFHILPADRFARDPGEWFRLIGPTQAMITSAPSSAWAAALRAVVRNSAGVDLSSLILAMFGQEMVDPDVVDRLQDVGGRLGLRPEVLSASYGLSEGGGTMTVMGQGIRIDEVDLETLVEEGRAVPATGSGARKRVAGCGVPIAGLEVRVGSPVEAQPERHVGEILFRGDVVMDGYVATDEDPVETGWLRTGDLGYLADGELFVTGRSKEIIVRFGRNYHPEDFEWAAARVPGVRRGGCVAFAPRDAAEGTVVVAVERLDDDDADTAALQSQVRSAVSTAVGFGPRDVVVLPEGAIPRAANGKLRRLATRDAYERGELG